MCSASTVRWTKKTHMKSNWSLQKSTLKRSRGVKVMEVAPVAAKMGHIKLVYPTLNRNMVFNFWLLLSILGTARTSPIVSHSHCKNTKILEVKSSKQYKRDDLSHWEATTTCKCSNAQVCHDIYSAVSHHFDSVFHDPAKNVQHYYFFVTYNWESPSAIKKKQIAAIESVSCYVRWCPYRRDSFHKWLLKIATWNRWPGAWHISDIVLICTCGWFSVYIQYIYNSMILVNFAACLPFFSS